MKKAGTTVIALLLTGAALSAGAQEPAQAAEVDEQVPYTVCSLFAGFRDGRAGQAGTAAPAAVSGSGMTIVMGPSKRQTIEDLQKTGERLLELQGRLREAFQLERLESLASLADWMPVGREMDLRSSSSDVRLLVTATGVTPGGEPRFVTATPEQGRKVPMFEQGYVAGRTSAARSAEYHVRLTRGPLVVLDKTMRVPLGERTVFASRPVPDGPLYFVVISAAGTLPQAAGVIWGDKRIRGPRLLSGRDLLTSEQAGKRRVLLIATIGVDGSVRDISVQTPVEGLTEKAVAVLKQRRYEPARDEKGEAIEVRIVVWMPAQEDEE